MRRGVSRLQWLASRATAPLRQARAAVAAMVAAAQAAQAAQQNGALNIPSGRAWTAAAVRARAAHASCKRIAPTAADASEPQADPLPSGVVISGKGVPPPSRYVASSVRITGKVPLALSS